MEQQKRQIGYEKDVRLVSTSCIVKVEKNSCRIKSKDCRHERGTYLRNFKGVRIDNSNDFA
jgi:hypothetical protein